MDQNNNAQQNVYNRLMDAVNVLSLIIGLENMDLNISANDLNDVANTILDDLHERLDKLDEHLQSQDKRLEQQELRLYRLENILTRGELCQDMNFQGLENGVRGIQQGLCDGFYSVNSSLLSGFAGVDNAVCNLGYNIQQGQNNTDMSMMQGFNSVNSALANQGYQMQQGFNSTNIALMQGQNALQAQLSDCCCENRAAIADVKYQMATDTCAIQNTIQNTTRDIIDTNNANTRSILDFLVQDKISTLQTENAQLRLKASQSEQNTYLINQLRPCPIPSYQTCNPWAASYGVAQSCGCGM